MGEHLKDIQDEGRVPVEALLLAHVEKFDSCWQGAMVSTAEGAHSRAAWFHPPISEDGVSNKADKVTVLKTSDWRTTSQSFGRGST